jgi:hypothetical protein
MFRQWKIVALVLVVGLTGSKEVALATPVNRSSFRRD